MKTMSNDISPRPLLSVWEITAGCNMRCLHCGSSCDFVDPDELTTEEALEVVRQMKEAGLKEITLSGGEPTTRKDILTISKALSDANINISWLSNGWLFNQELLDKAYLAGVKNIGMSLDGLEQTHDNIRCEGSFQRVMATLDLLGETEIFSNINTTINKKNLGELRDIATLLQKKRVQSWQLQIGLPMGNLKKNEKELLLAPEDMIEIIESLHEISQTQDYPKIYLADSIGYYHVQEIGLKRELMSADDSIWAGCGAGKSGFGVLNNGDIVPCTSLRNSDYVEGNFRADNLSKLWENGFSYFRDFSNEQLTGFCSDCTYSPICRGGCANTRHCTHGCIESENIFCAYRVIVEKEVKSLPNAPEWGELSELIANLEHSKSFQILNSYLQKIISLSAYTGEQNRVLKNALAFTYFGMELYTKCICVCESVLLEDKNDVRALKGLGLAHYEIGQTELGKKYLYQSLALSTSDYMDSYTDLIAVLLNEGDVSEATAIFYRQALDKNDNYQCEHFQSSIAVEAHV